MILRILSGVVLAALCLSSSLYGQSIQMDDLPGWDRYQAASEALSTQQIRSVTPTRLHWSTDEGKLFYSLRDQGRMARTDA